MTFYGELKLHKQIVALVYLQLIYLYVQYKQYRHTYNVMHAVYG